MSGSSRALYRSNIPRVEVDTVGHITSIDARQAGAVMTEALITTVPTIISSRRAAARYAPGVADVGLIGRGWGGYEWIGQ